MRFAGIDSRLMRRCTTPEDGAHIGYVSFCLRRSERPSTAASIPPPLGEAKDAQEARGRRALKNDGM